MRFTFPLLAALFVLAACGSDAADDPAPEQENTGPPRVVFYTISDA